MQSNCLFVSFLPASERFYSAGFRQNVKNISLLCDKQVITSFRVKLRMNNDLYFLKFLKFPSSLCEQGNFSNF